MANLMRAVRDSADSLSIQLAFVHRTIHSVRKDEKFQERFETAQRKLHSNEREDKDNTISRFTLIVFHSILAFPGFNYGIQDLNLTPV